MNITDIRRNSSRMNENACIKNAISRPYTIEGRF